MADEALDLGELKALSPADVSIELGGRRIVIAPLMLDELAEMIEASVAIEKHLFNFGGALVENLGAARRFLRVGARVDDALLGTLSMPDSVALATKIVEANPDFFAQMLARNELASLGESAVMGLLGDLAGSTPSPASSPQDSPAPT